MTPTDLPTRHGVTGDVAGGIGGETTLHGCRIVAVGRIGPRLDVHLVATAVERKDHLAALAGAAATVGHPSRAGLPIPTVPAPDVPLDQVFAFVFATAADAAVERVVLDHWGRHGTPVEGWVSGLHQASVLWDPATGITTGVRLPLGD